MSDNSRTIETKETNGNFYRLVRFNDKLVIYKDSKIQGKEAGLGQEIKQFNSEEKAKDFLKIL